MLRTRLVRHVPHDPRDLMNMVLDVEKYPEFIGFVSRLRRLSGEQGDEVRGEFRAEMVIGYKMFTERFRCRVSYDCEAQTIHVTELNDGGALRSLNNRWIFHKASNGSTLVEFQIKASLKNPILQMLASQKFRSVSEWVMDAFIRRAASKLPKVKGKIDVDAEMDRLNIKAV